MLWCRVSFRVLQFRLLFVFLPPPEIIYSSRQAPHVGFNVLAHNLHVNIVHYFFYVCLHALMGPVGRRWIDTKVRPQFTINCYAVWSSLCKLVMLLLAINWITWMALIYTYIIRRQFFPLHWSDFFLFIQTELEKNLFHANISLGAGCIELYLTKSQSRIDPVKASKIW